MCHISGTRQMKSLSQGVVVYTYQYIRKSVTEAALFLLLFIIPVVCFFLARDVCRHECITLHPECRRITPWDLNSLSQKIMYRYLLKYAS